MDVREKLEVIAHLGDHISYKEDIGICYDSALAKVIEDAYMTLKNGVTVQDVPDNNVDKWISVNDRLPEMRDDGFADAFLVTNGSLAHIAYFVDGDWIFTDNGQMKEPMFYGVTHWLCLPQPPKGE